MTSRVKEVDSVRSGSRVHTVFFLMLTMHLTPERGREGHLTDAVARHTI